MGKGAAKGEFGRGGGRRMENGGDSDERGEMKRGGGAVPPIHSTSFA
jgi:hypothetical protein